MQMLGAYRAERVVVYAFWIMRNSVVTGRPVRALMRQLCCLIVAVSFLTTYLYGQSQTVLPLSQTPVLYGNTSGLPHPDALSVFSRRNWLPSFSLSGLQSSGYGPPLFGSWLPGDATQLANQPWVGTVRPTGVGIALWAQNQQSLPDSPKPSNGQNSVDGEKNKKQQSSSATSGSPGHIFWVVPAFKVDYSKGFKPLTAKEKFAEWARGAYDPLGLGTGAVEAATLEHSSRDGFCGYGHGVGAYGECFGALELDANVSSFIGDFALTTLWHQDPRYFRLGEGSFGKRLWYAVSRVFVTYNDSGHTVFYSSALSGTAIAAGVSNLYYPKQDVGFGHTMSRVAIDFGNTALYNAAAEFWPDFHRKFRHIF